MGAGIVDAVELAVLIPPQHDIPAQAGQRDRPSIDLGVARNQVPVVKQTCFHDLVNRRSVFEV
jgi:hypothetical protein